MPMGRCRKLWHSSRHTAASSRSCSGMRARAAVACHSPANSSEPTSRVPSSPRTPLGSRHSRTPPSRMSAKENVVCRHPEQPGRQGVRQDEAQPGQQRRDEAGALPGGQRR